MRHYEHVTSINDDSPVGFHYIVTNISEDYFFAALSDVDAARFELPPTWHFVSVMQSVGDKIAVQGKALRLKNHPVFADFCYRVGDIVTWAAFREVYGVPARISGCLSWQKVRRHREMK